jgi:hypothetical protein
VTYPGAGEESPRGRQVPLLGHQHVNDLPELVDRPVQIDPPASDLDVGLVDKPPITRGMPAESGGVDQQRSEPLHPAIDRNVVDIDTALGQQFLDIAVGQAIPEVPAHRHHDHIRREAEPSEARMFSGFMWLTCQDHSLRVMRVRE